MTDKIAELESIESPCIGQCCLNDRDICLGCYRSLDEITNWTLVDNETRRQYLENIAVRKERE